MIPARLQNAATTFGPLRLHVFLTITLPLAVPVFIAGSVLCFSRSLCEFGATMAFVGNIPGETRTLPLAIYSLTHQPNGEAGALRLTLLSIALAVAALLLSHWISRRPERVPASDDYRGSDPRNPVYPNPRNAGLCPAAFARPVRAVRLGQSRPACRRGARCGRGRLASEAERLPGLAEMPYPAPKSRH